MADLHVNIAGVAFENPLIAASGTFGFGREYQEFYPLSTLGGISCKGITLQERLGNPPPRIAETPSGMLNSVGLQNPGVDHFIEEDLPWLKQQGTVVIANIAGNTQQDYCRMAEKLSDSDVDMVELNISCPNVKHGGVAFGTSCASVEEITVAVRKYCKKPLMVKLSPNVADIAEIAAAAEAGGADAISLINTLTGMRIDIRTRWRCAWCGRRRSGLRYPWWAWAASAPGRMPWKCCWLALPHCRSARRSLPIPMHRSKFWRDSTTISTKITSPL